MLKVRHILCKTECDISKALEKLKTGAHFDETARQFSEDKAKVGGSLGWKIRGSMLNAFEEAAFGLPVSTVIKPIYTNSPVRTKFGFHIIMVEGKTL